MFAVGSDHEKDSGEVKTGNLPHIEFLDECKDRVSYAINTR